jgi:hypothetical protein
VPGQRFPDGWTAQFSCRSGCCCDRCDVHQTIARFRLASQLGHRTGTDRLWRPRPMARSPLFAQTGNPTVGWPATITSKTGWMPSASSPKSQRPPLYRPGRLQRMLDGKLDAVVIQTPPYFHPEQAAAAVEAGKHVFLSKPVAVDVPGCLSIARSGQRATEKNLVYLVDFQTRANPLYREALRRVRAGDLGHLVMGEAHYPWAGGGPRRPAGYP